VGVIGVALFRERRPMPVSPALEREDRDAAADAQGAAKSSRAEEAAPAAREQPKAANTSEPSGRLAHTPESKLGTGHGQREYSSVEQTAFEREQDSPNEMIRIRYDSRANLVAMGVIPKPRPRHLPDPQPNPFPESPALGYVPDPPG
jgi:hypothetical protein